VAVGDVALNELARERVVAAGVARDAMQRAERLGGEGVEAKAEAERIGKNGRRELSVAGARGEEPGRGGGVGGLEEALTVRRRGTGEERPEARCGTVGLGRAGGDIGGRGAEPEPREAHVLEAGGNGAATVVKEVGGADRVGSAGKPKTGKGDREQGLLSSGRRERGAGATLDVGQRGSIQGLKEAGRPVGEWDRPEEVDDTGGGSGGAEDGELALRIFEAREREDGVDGAADGITKETINITGDRDPQGDKHRGAGRGRSQRLADKGRERGVGGKERRG